MKPIQEKLTYFKQKQAELTDLHAAFKKQEMELVQEHGQKAQALKAEYEAKIADAGKDLREQTEKYKAETKATFGVADGEAIDVVSTAAMFQRVLDLQ
jgi:hypothetical protein